MLCELQIENIAIIKKSVINFEKGFNVMTGETGAGKSIIIDSLNAVLGVRTSRELIRTECDSAFVSALFYENSTEICAVLKDMDLPFSEDGELLIQRRLYADGRNQCKINGMTVTVSAVRQVAKNLVNIHGQSDNQMLLSPEYHCAYIDKLAENVNEFAAYQTAYAEYLTANQKLQSLNTNENEKLRRLDILNYQIEELENADIREGEIADIEERLSHLRNAEYITDALQRAHMYLNGEEDMGGAVSLSFDAASALENIAQFSEEYNEMCGQIREAAYTLSANCDDLRDRLFSDAYDPKEIDVLEERLDTLYTLKKKYGDSEQEMLAFLENAKEERDTIEMSDEIKAKLLLTVQEKYDTAMQAAMLLHETRVRTADAFCKNVASQLCFLDMPSVRFTVQSETGELTENGIDMIEFLLSANAGEEPKPLAKIASGGELSRIMLAIKSVLAEKDAIGTLIFDEIDTGVSGRAAQKIAIKLKQVSKNHQVICVTHLAQIAAFGDTHMLIEKAEHDGQTFTQVQPLDFIGRKHELARILGGLTVTELQLQSAEELLRAAENEKIG
ncbi:MAG: DNA repair protein RecN [Lachnospiraceae bacterium]